MSCNNTLFPFLLQMFGCSSTLELQNKTRMQDVKCNVYIHIYVCIHTSIIYTLYPCIFYTCMCVYMYVLYKYIFRP